MIYRTDYHVHTTFSDGRATPEEYFSYAEKAGLSELGFSDHLSLFGENYNWLMNPEDAGKYLDYIGNLGKINNKILVKKGLEIDFFPGKETQIEMFLGKLDLDYRLGSVHYLGELSVDNGPEVYEGKNIDVLFDNYFDMVITAIESGLFDIIAHCDLIRIYGFKPVTDQENNYRRLASSMKKNNVAFEINTNGRNRPFGDFYPDRRFLKIFREEKVPVCVNSDAHFPVRTAQFFDEAYKMLAEAGFKEMAVFSKRERIMKPFSL